MKLLKGLAPLLLIALVTTGCDNTTSTSSNGSTQQPSGSDSSTSTPPEIIEVVKKFTLTTQAEEGTIITILNSQENYEAGTPVQFLVAVSDASKELTSVTVNDKFISPVSDNMYEIFMPNQNSVIKTTTKSLGDSSIVNVSDVKEESIPTTTAELHETIQASILAESKYMAYATYDSTYEGSSVASLTLDAVVYNDDVVFVDGRSLASYDSVAMPYYIGAERGIIDDRYYSFEKETRVEELTTEGTLLSIVPDDTESLLNSQISESEAKVNATTSGFTTRLLDSLFGNKTESFLNENTSYGWKNFEFEPSIAEDKKSYTLEVSGIMSEYSDRRTVSLIVEIDGDNFIRNASFVYNYYDKEDFDDETNAPLPGAEPTTVKEISMYQERGYRATAPEKTDIENYVMHDYDVNVSYKLDGQSEKKSVDGVVENSSTLSFTFRNRDYSPVIFTPILVGSVEEGFITFVDSKPVVSAEGNFTLIFDNGLGELFEVPLKSVRPVPYSINVTMANSLFANAENLVTVAISPSAAAQDAKIDVKEGSEVNANITNNNDGTFTVVPTSVGNGTLVVSSTVDPSISKEVKFTSIEKPTVEGIQSFLTTNTLLASISGWGNHYINFEMDGTGKYVCFEGSKGEVVNFTWSLDSNTLEVTIVPDENNKSGYYTLEGITDVTNSSATLKFGYYSQVKTGSLVAMDSKLDLDTAELE